MTKKNLVNNKLRPKRKQVFLYSFSDFILVITRLTLLPSLDYEPHIKAL